jgi:DNA-binding CsgD family transcriptional regulator
VIARDTLGDPDAAGYAPQRDLASPPGEPVHHFQALSRSESRVLRYLQTNLSAQEIADELCVSVNTVKTHQRHLYQKLGARSRSQAVKQARALGLLTPPAAAGAPPRAAADRRNHQNRGMPAHPPRPDAGRYGRPSAPSRQDRPVQH